MQLLSIPLALLPGMLIDRRRARELGQCDSDRVWVLTELIEAMLLLLLL